MASEANEPGSEGRKRSDDRRGAARGTRAGRWSPQEGGASNHSAARLSPRSPGSFAAAAMIYPDGLLAAHQVDQVAELGEEELLHRELDRGRRAGERDDDLAARHTRHGARQHGRRAHLLVRDHAEELAEAVEALLEEARDRLVGGVARREP